MRIAIRLTEEQHALLREAANYTGVDLTNWARWRLIAAARAELKAKPASKPPKREKEETIMFNGRRRSVEELLRTGEIKRTEPDDFVDP